MNRIDELYLVAHSGHVARGLGEGEQMRPEGLRRLLQDFNDVHAISQWKEYVRRPFILDNGKEHLIPVETYTYRTHGPEVGLQLGAEADRLPYRPMAGVPWLQKIFFSKELRDELKMEWPDTDEMDMGLLSDLEDGQVETFQ